MIVYSATQGLTFIMHWHIYRVSQEECARLREGVPYVKVYRYNPKHLCPKLNGYGDKGARKVVFLRFHVLYLVRVTYYPYAAHCPSLSTIGSSAFLAATAHVKCLVTQRTTMT